MEKHVAPEPAGLERVFQQALAHHQAGRLAEAEAGYRDVLGAQPDHPDALHLLGLIALQSGRTGTAIDLIGRAVDAAPDFVEAISNLGVAHQLAGRLQDAAACYEKTLSLQPAQAETLRNLGAIRHAQGRLAEALSCMSKAVALDPTSAEAHFQLGNVLNDLGRLDEAEASLSQAIGLDPGHAKALSNRGNILKSQNRLEQAIDCYQRAITLMPDSSEVWFNLGNALKEQGHSDKAAGCLRKALALRPDYPEALLNLGTLLNEQGRPEDAIVCISQAIALKQDYAEAHNNMGIVMLKLARHAEAEISFQRAIAIAPGFAEAYNNLAPALADQGRLDEAMASYRESLKRKPELVDAYGSLLFLAQLNPALSWHQVLDEHLGFARQFEAPLKPCWRRHANARDAKKRLKVGYVSADFREHAVAHFIEPVLARHDKTAFEIFCYHNSARHDATTERIRGYPDHWVPCKDLSDAQLAERIRADGIDILIDLSGHTSGNRLLAFAHKPAPVQVTYLGYPGTTGLSAMDYRITDACADPAGSDAFYSEQLIRLPDSLWCYRPADNMPAIAPLPALHNGFITFGSLNGFGKIDRQSIGLWITLLLRLPAARLIFITVPEGVAREKLQQQFASAGIEPDRLELHGRMPPAEFHKMIQRVDIALDPVFVNGATTTCESLWMGVPTLSVVGNRFLQRAGFSILSAAGLIHLAAASLDEYVGMATALASDIPALAKLHDSLPTQVAASPLTNASTFTRHFEAALRHAWEKWCVTPT